MFDLLPMVRVGFYPREFLSGEHFPNELFSENQKEYL